MSGVLSFRDWYSEGVIAGSRQIHRSVLPEAHRIVDAGPVHLINMTPPAGAVVDPPVPEYAVHLMLRTPPLLRVGFNRPPRWLVMSPGVLLVAPPDTAGDFIADGPSHLLTMTIRRRGSTISPRTAARGSTSGTRTPFATLRWRARSCASGTRWPTMRRRVGCWRTR